MGLLRAGFAAALGLCAATGAQAQVCSSECSRYIEGQCVEHTETCTTPPPPETYGAIAYGRANGGWGYSHGWNTRAKAESVAMQNCAQRAKDCQVVVWYDRRCGAVSVDQANAVYWGIGETSSRATVVARNQCVTSGGRGCAVKVVQCSR